MGAEPGEVEQRREASCHAVISPGFQDEAKLTILLLLREVHTRSGGYVSYGASQILTVAGQLILIVISI